MNLVAVLYHWSITWAARRIDARPSEAEETLAHGRGRVRRRTLVLETMGGRFLEISITTIVVALSLWGLSRATRANQALLSSILDGASIAVALLPLGLFLGILLWALVPSRHHDGWFSHPDRLWPATILGFAITAALTAADMGHD